MGYHQLKLYPDSGGKLRYACMPQGAGPSSILFNIHTDPHLRGRDGIYKYIDNYYTRGAHNITIYNDAKNMGTFMWSDMNNI